MGCCEGGAMVGQGGARSPVTGTRQGDVFNYLAIYRAEHPLPGETTRLSVLARPPGFQRSIARRMLITLAGIVVVFIAFLVGSIAAYAIGFAAIAATLLAVTVLALKHDRAFPPLAVMLTDQRFVVLAGVRGRDPEVRQELAADRVTWASTTEAAGAFPLRRPICTVALGGSGGVVCELEMPGSDPRSLRLTFDAAALGEGPAASTGG